jgi:hypothetical protein
MPVADDDYRKRLARRKMDRSGSGGSLPIEGYPYAAGFQYLGNFIGENMNPGFGIVNDLSAGNTKGALVTAALSAAGGKGRGAGRLIDKVPTPVLQRAIQAASMEGKRIGGQFIEEGARKGVRFDQGGVARAGRAGEDALFEMINNFERIGANPQTLTRFLKGFAKYGDEPLDAMIDMGEDVSRTTVGFKEALIDRMLRNISTAAERDFF